MALNHFSANHFAQHYFITIAGGKDTVLSGIAQSFGGGLPYYDYRTKKKAEIDDVIRDYMASLERKDVPIIKKDELPAFISSINLLIGQRIFPDIYVPEKMAPADVAFDRAEAIRLVNDLLQSKILEFRLADDDEAIFLLLN